MDVARIVKVGSGFGAKIEVLRASYRTQSFARHSHGTYTLGLVRGGAGSFWCRGAERVVGEGHIVVIPPGEVHTGSVDVAAGFLSYIAIYLPPDLALAHAEALGHETDPLEFRPLVFQDRGVAKAFRALDHATDTGDRLPRPSAENDCESSDNEGEFSRPSSEDGMESAACEAISALFARRGNREVECSPIGTLAPRRESRVAKLVRDVLEDSFASGSETSLQELAKLTGVTPFRVIRAFRETTGMAPHQYLIQVRVERARQFLAAGANPSLAALQSGFVDQSHLTYHFRKRFGITPGNYRRCVASQ